MAFLPTPVLAARAAPQASQVRAQVSRSGKTQRMVRVARGAGASADLGLFLRDASAKRRPAVEVVLREGATVVVQAGCW